MISNPKLQDLGFTQAVPVINVVIDEASQIEVGQYVPLIKTFGNTLRKLCFIGDDKQRKSSFPRLRPKLDFFVVPPHGQDDLGNLKSIFELDHLKDRGFLDTQCVYQVSMWCARLANLALKTVCHPKSGILYPNMSTMANSSQTRNMLSPRVLLPAILST